MIRSHRRRVGARALATVRWVVALAVIATGAVAPTRASADSDAWTAVSERYEPENYRAAPFLGNGRIGTIIPATGAGYQSFPDGVRGPFPLRQPRYTGTYLAGFYARQTDGLSYDQIIAALPAWSGLTIDLDGHSYRPGVAAAQVRAYRQTVDFRRATVTTSAVWSPDRGHRVQVSYRTFVSRTQPNLAVQQLTVTPQFAGRLDVTDLIDTAAARRATPISAHSEPATGHTTVAVRADGTTDTAYLVSALDAGDHAALRSVRTADGDTGLTADLRVGAGQGYTITKYVGIAATVDSPDPQRTATAVADTGRRLGWDRDLADHAEAWARLWRPSIDIPGRPDYRGWIRSAFYAVLSSVRAGQSWSIPPAGLSSDDYGGMIYWDADTWIFPALLALYPDLARTIVDFRWAALPQARANARGFGLPGALYPWNNGPAQRCVTPLECGLYEEHLPNDVALAQWQYYLATRDSAWLRDRGAPVITALADYLTARVGPKLPDGRYHLAPATGADEYAVAKIDHALTNAGVAGTMRIAIAAAAETGRPGDPRWSDIAANMAMPPDIRPGVPAEYLGYPGNEIKQADTVLLSYPYSYTAADYSPTATLDYYVHRTDPNGPNMTDSAEAVLASQYAPCRVQHFLDRSAAAYVLGPFGFQSEIRGASGQPAWIFVTGSGGFLQGVLYGPTGLRWTDPAVQLNPMLPNGFPRGMTIRGLAIEQRLLTVAIGPSTTTVTLNSGRPLVLATPVGTRTITEHSPLLLPTRTCR